MFSDVDESLRELLVADMPIEQAEVDVTFDRPNREWSSRISKPTVNLFLADIRERRDMRDDVPVVKQLANGQVTRQRPPRRVDLSYMVTAWAKEPLDEHRILARAMAVMFRHARLPDEHTRGVLADSPVPVQLRVGVPDQVGKPYDIWSVLDNELRASLTWIATAPLEAYAPFTGPIVRTRELLVGAVGEEWRERSLQIGGIAYRKGSPAAGVAGVQVSVAGTTLVTRTDEAGKFTLMPILAGQYRWRIETPEGEVREHSITVPSASYDIEV